MRPARLFILLLALALLGACAPLEIYYRPGVEVARLEADRTQCEVRALRDAPVATQIRQAPPRYVPGRRICKSNGECYRRPGFWIDGEIYTVDVNADLRARVLDQCMYARGYGKARLPNCPAAVAEATPPGVTRVLPQLTDDACVIRNRGGSWQIVP